MFYYSIFWTTKENSSVAAIFNSPFFNSKDKSNEIFSARKRDTIDDAMRSTTKMGAHGSVK